MRNARIAIFAVMVAFAGTAGAQPVPRSTFELVNAGYDSIVTLAIADAGGHAFEPIALEAPLQGGVSVGSLPQ